MTQQQLLVEIEHLPVAEQIQMAENIMRRVREKLALSESESFDPTAIDRLHGIIKWDGPPPTDEEVEQIRYDYLMEKYG